MSNEARDVLTVVTLLGILVPSILFSFFTIVRLYQIFGTFGKAASRVRRRFLAAKFFSLLSILTMFLAIQGVIDYPEPVLTRTFFFMLSFICLEQFFGWSFLAWDRWWIGVDPDRRNKGRRAAD